jgi:hypothetical protein
MLDEAGLFSDPVSLDDMRAGLGRAVLETKCTEKGEYVAGQVKDEEAAYLQTRLKGDTVYFDLSDPQFRQLFGKDVQDMHCPVTAVEGAVYGVGRSGFDYEAYRNKRLEKSEWANVKGTRSVWWRDITGNGLVRRYYLFTYVDDFLLVGSNLLIQEAWKSLKDFTWKESKTQDKVDQVNFLGMQISFTTDRRGVNYVKISQSKYAQYIVGHYEKLVGRAIRGRKTPAQPWQIYEPASLDSEGVWSKTEVQSILGMVAYLARGSRPELIYGTNRLLRGVTRWMLCHDSELERLIGHIKHTIAKSLTLTGNPFEEVTLHIDVDADHAGDMLDRRSVSGMCVYIIGKDTLIFITLTSRGQRSVGKSSGETELIAIGEHAGYYARIGDVTGLDPKVRTDSSVAKSTIQNGYTRTMYYITKHQGTNIAFLHDLFFANSDMRLTLGKVASDDNFSDIGTKPLERMKFERDAERLGVA